MSITQEQRLKRQKYCCSSDAAPILGLSPFGKSAWDVWCEKKYDMKEMEDNDSLLFGRLIEPVLATYASEKTGYPFDTRSENLEYIKGWHMSHPDGDFFNKPRLIGLECKSSRLPGWGKDEDDIPEYVYCQIQHQCMVCGYDEVVVPAITRSLDAWIKIYTIPRDQEVIDMLQEELDNWWQKYIIDGIEPDKTDTPLPNMNTLKRIIRQPQTLTSETLPQELIDRWNDLKKKHKEADEAEEQAKAEIITLLGQCEGGLLLDGSYVAYMEENAGRRVKTEDFKRLYPEIYEQVSENSTRKVLRLKKAR